MNSRELQDKFLQSTPYTEVIEKVKGGRSAKMQITGLSGSAPSILSSLLFTEIYQPILWITHQAEKGLYLKNDLENLTGSKRVFFLNDSYRKPYHLHLIDNNRIRDRADVIEHISGSDKPFILITTPEALCERIINEENLAKNKVKLKVGDQLDLEFLVEVLSEYRFSREDFVYEPGQFAIRGGIVDVFSYGNNLPYRLELNGLEVESIREFDPTSQLSVRTMALVNLLPNIHHDEIAGERVNLFHHLPENTLVLGEEFETVFHQITKGKEQAQNQQQDSDNKTNKAAQILENPENLRVEIRKKMVLEFGSRHFFSPTYKFKFDTQPQPAFGKNFQHLIGHLHDNKIAGKTTVIFSESSKQVERLNRIFEDLEADVEFSPIFQGLSAGFECTHTNICCYTEHQIFSRHFAYRKRNSFSKNQALTLKELKDLKPGDFVTHIDHGVGVFEGLQKMEMGGKIQEAVKLKYKNNDLLFVNIGSLHKISKFTGKEGHEPRLNKLGSDAWQKLKNKTKKKVKDITRELIQLYAKRKAQPGYQFTPDSYLQTELEASFMYEDTPDQSKATEALKADMEQPHPMDRLVCGDVGFGKTEVAIRAAFKAVADSKQVAILVPTTILAQQHYHTFKDRLDGFPVTVDYVNRFKSTKSKNETLKKLKEGKVDIIIGTHVLLNKKVEFKDLGLMVIDEEQKFGVSAKEKLKQLRTNVDSLTLTATPIPRTLHFSLMGARDLSIINTPPPNRQAVNTELQTFSKELIQLAIQFELDRGGQAFVVHNRVKDIESLADLIRESVPGARVAVGHGQMSGDALEDIMVGFVEGEYDVLVATTIIESGLDIPNANTIIINNAHHFGMSDLHQMRGRVGRSNTKAYCYLLAPPVYSLTDDARRRLQAIEEFSALGSGFNVAMRDLDIRGAGNLLGSEQSGFINEIGFDVYHKLLDEVVEELKQNEFKGVFEKENQQAQEAINQWKTAECQVETDFDILIPDHYVSNISERLSLYSELAKIDTEDKLLAFENELRDRFGKIPDSVYNLLQSVKVKWAAQDLGFTRITCKQNAMRALFPSDDNEQYYQSDDFKRILELINTERDRFELKQKGDKLYLMVKKVNSLQEALNMLHFFAPQPQTAQA